MWPGPALIQHILRGTCIDAVPRVTAGALMFVPLPADNPLGHCAASLALLRLCLSTGAHPKEIMLGGTLEGKQDQFKLSRSPVARTGSSARPWYPAAA